MLTDKLYRLMNSLLLSFTLTKNSGLLSANIPFAIRKKELTQPISLTLKKYGTVVTSRETKLSDGQLKQAMEHRIVEPKRFCQI